VRKLSIWSCLETSVQDKITTLIGNESFERMDQFKYLGTARTDHKCIHEEINSRLNLGNACYCLVQILLLSSFLSKNIKIKIQGKLS
jgi:hypothetical protein